MNQSNQLNQINHQNQQKIYDSAVSLPEQCSHAFTDASQLNIPDHYQQIDNLIFAGMGGSLLAARLINSLYLDQLSVPLVLANNYILPRFADQKTLLIASSYSGSTEEIVSLTKQALAKNCKILIVSKGKTLLELAKQHQLPAYIINPTHNPSQQPRMAVGYSVIGQLTLLAKANLIKFSKTDLQAIISTMNAVIKQNKINIATEKNPAKKLAQLIKPKQVVLVASEHLCGAAHTVKNQMNENAKHFANRHDLPELNHHLMEGLQFPQTNSKNLLFWFINSDLYSPRISQRLALTTQVVEKNKIQTHQTKLKGKTKLVQAFELIQYGALVNFYLALAHKIDPTPIPWVDYFKKKLNQLPG